MYSTAGVGEGARDGGKERFQVAGRGGGEEEEEATPVLISRYPF